MIKKIFCLEIALLSLVIFFAVPLFAQNPQDIRLLVLPPECVNVPASETTWLPEKIQSKMASNFQDYLDITIVADINTERKLLQIQKQNENISHSEKAEAVSGNITSANTVCYSKIIKTPTGYSISADFRNLSTGETLVSVQSKEVTLVQYLDATAGIIDALTLKIAQKLSIKMPKQTENYLTSGNSAFSLDDNITWTKNFDKQIEKQQKKNQEEINKLRKSMDLNATENIKKLEAENAILKSKQEQERKRQQELEKQKQKIMEDEKLDANRSQELKARRTQIALLAENKAQEIRKLKLENQTISEDISLIETKKKVLLEIQKKSDSECKKMKAETDKQIKSEVQKIKDEKFGTGELENGKPTAVALKRRANRIENCKNELKKKLYENCSELYVASKESELKGEIENDIKNLTKYTLIDSFSDELSVTFGDFSGKENAWNCEWSFSVTGSDISGTGTFLLPYTAVTGKQIPTENSSDADWKDYNESIDMYSSLLKRSSPIIYCQLVYKVSGTDLKWGLYMFDFEKLDIKDTVSDKSIYDVNLKKKMNFQGIRLDITSIASNPEYELETPERIKKEQEQKKIAENKKKEEEKQKHRENAAVNYIAPRMGIVRLSAGFDIPVSSFNYIEVGIYAPFKYFVLGFDFQGVPVPDKYQYLANSNMMFTFTPQIGFILRLPDYSYSLGFYALLGASFSMVKGYKTYSYDFNTIKPGDSLDDWFEIKSRYGSEEEKYHIRCFQATFGLDFPVCKWLSVYVQNSIFAPYFRDVISFGTSILL